MAAKAATWGLAMTFILGGVPEGAEAAGPAPVQLAWLDVNGTVTGIDEMARAECRSVLRRAGREVVWRQSTRGEEARPDEIRVILVDQILVDPVEPRFILGATPPAPRAFPVAWIHVGSVQATIGIPPGFPTPELLPLRARRALALALGRVMAHEVVHVLAPGLEHGHGLMAPTLTPDELTTARLSLERGQAEQLGKARPGRPAPAGGAGVLAAAWAVGAGH